MAGGVWGSLILGAKNPPTRIWSTSSMFRCVAINILMQFLGCKYCRNILNSNFVFCTSKYPPTYKINEPLLEYVVAGLYCWVEYVLTNHVVKSIDFMPELDNVNLLHRIELFTGTSSWWMLASNGNIWSS